MRSFFPPSSLRTLAGVVFPIIVLCLVVVNVGLQLRARALRARVVYLEQTRGPRQGETMPDLAGTDLDGHPLTISFASSDRPSLLLVYSPQCPYCEKNLAQWHSLLSDRLTSSVFLLDVSGHMTRQDAGKMNLPVLSGLIRLSNSSRLESNLSVTPTTVVISRDGLVKYAALGVLDKQALNALRASLR